MLVLHTIWSNRAVHLWAESAALYLERSSAGGTHGVARADGDTAPAGTTATLAPPATDQERHTLAAPISELRDALARHGALDSDTLARCSDSTIALHLPWDDTGPRPSDWRSASASVSLGSTITSCWLPFTCSSTKCFTSIHSQSSRCLKRPPLPFRGLRQTPAQRAP